MKFVAKAFSTFFGAGYFPIAPGTFASLIAALLYKFFLVRWNWPWYAALICLIFFLGALSCSIFSEELGQKDPRKIVIDEVCGQWLVYFLIAGTWTNMIIGFFLFRIFDVVKPPPIQKLEKLPGGWGIMADDILAAVYSAVLLHAYLFIK